MQESEIKRLESILDRRIKGLEDKLNGFMKCQIRINDTQNNINDRNIEAVKDLKNTLNVFMKAQITINDKQHDINDRNIEAYKLICEEIKRLDTKGNDDGK